jgi:D-alanyl-lipoteichoic acid acyltransferase DltB (MBOAT superfamily)
MIFNSPEFFIFFGAVFFLYYFVSKEKTRQNVLLLTASYVFYAVADWKILPPVIISTIVFYGLGIAVFQAGDEKRKNLIAASGIIVGAGMLLYFKYANFFILSFKRLFDGLGIQSDLHALNIVVPVGISFYTFRLLSYLIDISRNKHEPARNFVDFAAYVAFFPCILSGPIDRFSMFYPQIQKKRTFDYDLAVDGSRQILWGLFKKLVVANNCAMIVNDVYSNYGDCSGSMLAAGAILYVIQAYADFSGYSDMAIGAAKILGVRVTRNFNYPFFARNIVEFWRRWHISLTSWLTDYVFMPLNVKWRNRGKAGMILAVLVNFIVCGLWHGDKWTFVAFGLLHGLLFIPSIISGSMFRKTRIETFKCGFPKLRTLADMSLTFLIVTLSFILFRSESLQQAFDYAARMCTASILPRPEGILRVSLFSVLLIAVEWTQRNREHALQIDGIKNPVLRFGIYYAVISLVFIAGNSGTPDFIYFQF